ncbi:MAG: phosphoribosyltransferase, partial [Alphaproteobacteria bacterium]
MFRDRTEAGERLAERLAEIDLPRPVVLALPRGGVPVALPIARRLKAPIDLVMVRKLGVPGNPELAAGAVVDGSARKVIFNPHVLRAFGLSERD